MNSNKRRPFQRILFVVAIVSYLAAAGCLVAAVILNIDTHDPLVASLMASVVFFIGVGVVLHVIARTNLPNLKL